MPLDTHLRRRVEIDSGSAAPGTDWALQEFSELPSTNLQAAGCPPWHAVRADRQTAGRGRFQRTWISDDGGLWLSATLPVLPNVAASRNAPLSAGLALCEALAGYGVEGLRLRWPNDVLVGDRKLAGILVDKFSPDVAVVGIGLNVNNHPEAQDPLLCGQVCRLSDLVQPVPGLRELTERLLRSLANVWMHSGADADWLTRLNSWWKGPRLVELDLEGATISGQFAGVDAAGRLVLDSSEGEVRLFEPHEVRLLRDLKTA